jgi:hypothetical protein
MARTLLVLSFVCILAMTLRDVSAQKTVNVAGKWDVIIRMPDRTENEQWTIEQKGTAVTATAKAARGDLPASGTIDGAFFRVTIRNSNDQYKVRATVDGDAMDGSITMGRGTEYLWQAKRSKAK